MKFLRCIFSTGGMFKQSEQAEPAIRDLAPEYPLGAIVIKPEWDGTFGLYVKRLKVTVLRGTLSLHSALTLDPLTECRFASVEEAQQRLVHMDSTPFVIPPSEDA